MSLELLRARTDLEGQIKKTSLSKDGKCSGKFKSRWLALIGSRLRYYMKQSDNRPRGTIDMEHATVEFGEPNVTKKKWTIRIHNPEGTTWLELPSQNDQNIWLIALRKAAGYPDPAEEEEGGVTAHVRQYLSSFDILISPNLQYEDKKCRRDRQKKQAEFDEIMGKPSSSAATGEAGRGRKNDALSRGRDLLASARAQAARPDDHEDDDDEEDPLEGILTIHRDTETIKIFHDFMLYTEFAVSDVAKVDMSYLPALNLVNALGNCRLHSITFHIDPLPETEDEGISSSLAANPLPGQSARSLQERKEKEKAALAVTKRLKRPPVTKGSFRIYAGRKEEAQTLFDVLRLIIPGRSRVGGGTADPDWSEVERRLNSDVILQDYALLDEIRFTTREPDFRQYYFVLTNETLLAFMTNTHGVPVLCQNIAFTEYSLTNPSPVLVKDDPDGKSRNGDGDEEEEIIDEEDLLSDEDDYHSDDSDDQSGRRSRRRPRKDLDLEDEEAIYGKRDLYMKTSYNGWVLRFLDGEECEMWLLELSGRSRLEEIELAHREKELEKQRMRQEALENRRREMGIKEAKKELDEDATPEEIHAHKAAEARERRRKRREKLLRPRRIAYKPVAIPIPTALDEENDPLQHAEPTFVACWGQGKRGQIGNRRKETCLVPIICRPLSAKRIRQISAGEEHCAAVSDNGHVFMWGSGDKGQLGCGKKLTFSHTPYLCTSFMKFQGHAGIIKKVVCGAFHNLALSNKGRLFSWGSNSDGQLGQGGGPARIDPSYASYEKGSDEEESDSEGDFSDEGDDYYDGEEDSDGGHFELPQPILPSAGDGVPVKIGKELWYPQELPYFRTLQVYDCAAGFAHSACIAGHIGTELDADAEVYTWGSNDEGELGNNSTEISDVPILVEDLTAVLITKVGCGEHFTAALTADGDMFTWGTNEHGELATKKKVDNVLLPRKVAYFTKKETRVRQFALGGHHGVCVGDRAEREGIVFTWGKGIMNAFREDQAIPTRISALKQSTFAAAGLTHTVVINDKLELFAFGRNKYGELGNGEAGVQALVKCGLQAGTKVLQAACGRNFTMVLCRGRAPKNGVAIGGEPDFEAMDREKKQEATDAEEQALLGLLAGMGRSGGAPVTGSAQSDANQQITALMSQFGLLGTGGVAVPQPQQPQQPQPQFHPQSQQPFASSAASFAAFGLGDDLAAIQNLQASRGGHGFVQPSSSSSAAAAAAAAVGVSSASPGIIPVEAEKKKSKKDKKDKKEKKEKKKKKEKELPPGWLRVLDPATDRHFYVNEATGETQWKRPKLDKK